MAQVMLKWIAMSREPMVPKDIFLIYEVGEDDWVDLYRIIFERRGEPFRLNLRAVSNVSFDAQTIGDCNLIIINNLMMPKPDGWEVFDQIKRIPQLRDIPILMLSAKSQHIDEILALQFGVDDYVTKPFGPDELVQAVVNLLRLDEARRPNSATGTHLIRFEPIDLAVVKHLAAHSEELYRISPRFFEELLAELLHDRGWETSLSPRGADGGVDIIAIRQMSDVSHQMLVQAKRYAEHRKVDVRIVRELLHVVDHNHATSGMIVTTSGFTRNAMDLRKVYEWRLSLKDYSDLKLWLAEYVFQRSGGAR